MTSALLAAFVLAPVVAGTAPALSKSPFTVTNDPVEGTVVDTMLERTCSGTVVPLWWTHRSKIWVRAIWYRRPDGTKWVKFYRNGVGPDYFPVTEVGVSAQWISTPENYKGDWTHFAVWPDGDNRLSGKTVDPYGTINLTCE